MEKLEAALFKGVLNVSQVSSSKNDYSCRLCAPCDNGKGDIRKGYSGSCRLCAPCDNGK